MIIPIYFKPMKPNPIEIKPSHRGALHRHLGIKQGQKISVAQLHVAANSADPHVRKQANFALVARKWHH